MFIKKMGMSSYFWRASLTASGAEDDGGGGRLSGDLASSSDLPSDLTSASVSLGRSISPLFVGSNF